MEEGEDPGPSSIVARADALMQKRRNPAGLMPPEGEELPLLTEAVDPEEDLPILGEDQIVPERYSSPQPPDATLVEELAQEIARRVHSRLAAEIPGLVDAALQSTLEQLTRELQRAVAATSEEIIRDFLDEHPDLNRDRF